MIKLNISPQIIKLVKEQRDAKNMNASTFAKRIGKTNAYVSKFDKGDFKTIELNDLYSLIGFIHIENGESPIDEAVKIGEPIVNKFLDQYLLEDSEDSKISSIYKDDDDGLRNYDEVYKKIDIPSALIDYLNDRIEKQELTYEKIVKHCNANYDIDESIRKNNKLEFNTYYTNESNEDGFIIFHLDIEEINSILKKDQIKCSFITILMILYTINRLSVKPKISPMSASQFSYQALDKYGFRTLNMMRLRNRIEKMKNSEFEKLKNLPIDTSFVFARMVGYFDYISKIDLNYIINKTSCIIDNINSDPSLLMSLMEIDLEPVKDLNIQKKRELLNDIKELIKNYSENKSSDSIELL